MKLVLLGAGQRGMTYATYAQKSAHAEIVAVCDIDPEHLSHAADVLGVPAAHCYADADALFAQGKLGDAMLVCTMDRSHYGYAMRALEQGYDVLLEKPVSPVPEECVRLSQKAREVGRRVAVCHVLRYTPFYRAVKRILDSRELGPIVAIQHNENVGNYHFAHSFVRGNWRNEALSSPMLLQKSCHDMDLLAWLVGSPAKTISSFGGLRYFAPDHAPEGSTARCADCPRADECRFCAQRCYGAVLGDWPAACVCVEQTPSALAEALRTGPYGRCVYRCDNDVCDHQTVQIAFQNGVLASFVLSAFTNRVCRTTKIMCEQGELRANLERNEIELTRFAGDGVSEYSQRVLHPSVPVGGHGGGDDGLMDDFLSALDDPAFSLSSLLDESLESHYMVFAAERSRREGETVAVEAIRQAAMQAAETL